MQNAILNKRIRKTTKMKEVEERLSEKLETLLPRLINDQGMSNAADAIGAVLPGATPLLLPSLDESLRAFVSRSLVWSVLGFS